MSPPASIPDYLALVGDTADGFPGLPGWGAKSAAAVLARYGRLEDIPAAADEWDVPVRGAGKLAATLRATTSTTPCCSGASPPSSATRRPSTRSTSCAGPGRVHGFTELCAELDAPGLAARADKLAAARR